METHLLFMGLWILADREGRLNDRPKRITALLFPYGQHEPSAVDNMLEDLSSHGFIIRYSVGPDKYIQVADWRKWQNPRPSESASIIPPPTVLV